MKYSPSTALTASGMDSSLRAFRSWSSAFAMSDDMATIILLIAKLDSLPLYSDINRHGRESPQRAEVLTVARCRSSLHDYSSLDSEVYENHGSILGKCNRKLATLGELMNYSSKSEATRIGTD